MLDLTRTFTVTECISEHAVDEFKADFRGVLYETFPYHAAEWGAEPIPHGVSEHPRGYVEMLVEQGYKNSRDRRLKFRIPEFTALTFDEVAWLVAAFVHTETCSRGEPRKGKFSGGHKVIEHLKDYMTLGGEGARQKHKLKNRARKGMSLDTHLGQPN